MGGQIWRVGKIRWAMLTGYIFPEKKRNWILRVWIDLSMYVQLALQTCTFSWKLYRSELLSDTLCTSLLQIRLSHVHSQHPCYKKMYTLTPAHEIWNIWWIYLICFSSVVGVLNKSAADCCRPPFCNLSSPRCWITPAEWIKVLNQDLTWMSYTNGWTLRCSQQYLKDLGQTAPCKGLKTLQCIEMFFNSVFTEGLPEWNLLEIYPRNMAFRTWRNGAHHEDVIALKVLLLNQIFQIQVYLDKVLNWTSEVHDKLSDLVERFCQKSFPVHLLWWLSKFLLFCMGAPWLPLCYE